MTELYKKNKFFSCGCILFLLFLIIYIFLNHFFPPVTFAIHYCIIGLIIGCSIAQGLQEKYSYKKLILILIFLCFISGNIYTFGLGFLPFHNAIDTLFLCLTCLGIVGFIFYRKNRGINIFLVGVILFIYLFMSVIYKPQCHEFYNSEILLRLQQLYIILFSFFSLIIIKFISYILKQKAYPDKNKIFVWILLFSLIIHSGLSFVFYILTPSDTINPDMKIYPDGIKISNYWEFLSFRFYNNRYCLVGYPVTRHVYEDLPIYKIYDEIERIYEIITFHKISSDNLNLVIGIQVWLIEYFITVFSAWRFVLYACSCLSTLNNNDVKEKT